MLDGVETQTRRVRWVRCVWIVALLTVTASSLAAEVGRWLAARP